MHPFSAKRTFADRVCAIVAQIPPGKTMSYAQVAAAAGSPGAARAVGNIMMRNDDPRIPCHRVIRADGSPGGYNGLAGEKVRLLREEGALAYHARVIHSRERDMMKLTCKAMGMMDCPFEAMGETEEEVMMKSKEHGMAAHADKMKEMMATMSEQQIMDLMKSKIEQV